MLPKEISSRGSRVRRRERGVFSSDGYPSEKEMRESSTTQGRRGKKRIEGLVRKGTPSNPTS